MTAGLLISRTRKIYLHKMYITDPNQYLAKYRAYPNMYNSLIRAGKKLHYDYNFAKFAKNPKKIWNLLNEITGTKKNSNTTNIPFINENGTNISSPHDCCSRATQRIFGHKIFDQDSAEPNLVWSRPLMEAL
jgi:hypothetical protein